MTASETVQHDDDFADDGEGASAGDERSALTAIGVNLDTLASGSGASGVDFDDSANRILYRMAMLTRSLDRHAEARQRAHTFVDERYDVIEGPARRELAALGSTLEAIAASVPLIGKSKSRAVAFGSYGRKKIPAKATIIDVDAAIAWARSAHPECVIETPIPARVEVKLPSRDIARHVVAMVAKGDELPPGFDYTSEREEPQFKIAAEILDEYVRDELPTERAD